jgi:transcriptional antiterminator NusG
LPPEEINPILKKCGLIEEVSLDVQVGESVKVITGPFANQVGKIDSIDVEKREVKVLVDMFGRQTPVELTFDDIEKI